MMTATEKKNFFWGRRGGLLVRLGADRGVVADYEGKKTHSVPDSLSQRPWLNA